MAQVNRMTLATGMQQILETTIDQNDGFTLIELLIVLLIVSIVSAVAALTVGQMGHARREKIIAHQFVRMVAIAQQQAILASQCLELCITHDGYRFFVLHDQTWEHLHNDIFSQPAFFQLFPVIKINHMIISKNQCSNPILFLPSGLVTPFTLTLQDRKNKFVMIVNNNGVVKTL